MGPADFHCSSGSLLPFEVDFAIEIFLQTHLEFPAGSPLFASLGTTLSSSRSPGGIELYCAVDLVSRLSDERPGPSDVFLWSLPPSYDQTRRVSCGHLHSSSLWGTDDPEAHWFLLSFLLLLVFLMSFDRHGVVFGLVFIIPSPPPPPPVSFRLGRILCVTRV